MAQIKYFVSNGDGTFTENINGNIVGLYWVDASNHEYRAIISHFNKIDVINGNCDYNYLKQVKPNSMGWWLNVYEKNVKVHNENYVAAATGKLIDNPYQVIYDGYDENDNQLSHYKYEDYPAAMKQWDFFVYIMGKNVPQEPISLFQLLTIDLLRLEDLELDA